MMHPRTWDRASAVRSSGTLIFDQIGFSSVCLPAVVEVLGFQLEVDQVAVRGKPGIEAVQGWYVAWSLAMQVW